MRPSSSPPRTASAACMRRSSSPACTRPRSTRRSCSWRPSSRCPSPATVPPSASSPGATATTPSSASPRTGSCASASCTTCASSSSAWRTSRCARPCSSRRSRASPRPRRAPPPRSESSTAPSIRAPTCTLRRRPSATWRKFSPGGSSRRSKDPRREPSRRIARDRAQRQRRAREAQRPGAAQPGRFPEERAAAHRHARRLRARRVRRVHRARRRRDRARLPHARGAGGRLRGRYHRGPVRLARDRGAAERLRPLQRAAVRLLHPGHADGGAGAAARRAGPFARAHPRISLGQLLPLHRLPVDRRRDRGGGEGARREITMSDFDESTKELNFDSPNSYVGRSVTRPNARRLAQGRGQFVDDVVLARTAHVAYVRSPHAHARIVAIDKARAAAMPGVLRVVTGAEIAMVCKPWVGVLTHLAGMRSPPQYPLALDVARWQGEPVVAVVAQSRAEAEDAAEAVEVTYEELPAALDAERALDADAVVIHEEFGSNLCFQRTLDTGGVDAAMAAAHAVVEDTLVFGRHTGVTNEPRSILADYNRADETMTVYHSGQSPHMMQGIIASRLSLDEHRVRIVCRDVGGSFGIKIHTYGDEIAACALSLMLGRPVKFVADRLESFLADIHARDHRVKAKLALERDGRITALEIDDLTGIGPYSMFPRSSGVECNQVLNLTGGPYAHKEYRAKGTVVFQNKNMMCQYRAVGHPIAIAVAEHMVDQAAAKLELDPAEIRKRNLVPDDAYPYKSPSGMRFEALSHEQCMAKLLGIMDYEALRREQAELRKRRVYRGI